MVRVAAAGKARWLLRGAFKGKRIDVGIGSTRFRSLKDSGGRLRAYANRPAGRRSWGGRILRVRPPRARGCQRLGVQRRIARPLGQSQYALGHAWWPCAHLDTTPDSVYIPGHASAESRQAARPSEPKAPRPRRFSSPTVSGPLCTYAISTSPAQPEVAPVTPPTLSSPAFPSRSGTGGTPTAKCRGC